MLKGRVVISLEYQVAIIGAGPGGYVAAIHAARLGLKVCVIERNEVGGVCLNRGCIPTKTLVGSAKVSSLIKKSADYGIKIKGETSPDWNRILERKNEVVNRLVKGIHYLFEQNNVELIRGQAAFEVGHTIRISFKRWFRAEDPGRQYKFIATGSETHVPEVLSMTAIG